MKHDPAFNPAASACDGKHRYSTWAEAAVVIRRKNTAERMQGEDITALRPFRCQFCKAFHIAGPRR